MDNSVSNKDLWAKKAERDKIKKTIIYILLVIWAIIVIFPFYWMVLSSIKSYGDYNAESVPQFITLSPTFENYVIAFTSVPLLDYFINTIIFTVLTTLLMLVIIIPAAFAFARLSFKGKELVFLLFLSLMMIPGELVVITNFQQLLKGGLVDLHGDVLGIEDDAVLVVVDVGAVLQAPVRTADLQGHDAVVGAGGMVHAACVAFILRAQLALGVAGLGSVLGGGDSLGILLGLGQIDGDVQLAILRCVLPAHILGNTVAADVVGVAGELVVPVGGLLGALLKQAPEGIPCAGEWRSRSPRFLPPRGSRAGAQSQSLQGFAASRDRS